ncbi:MAG: hypothetical protein QM744_16275 [Mesorhizobium sp.]
MSNDTQHKKARRKAGQQWAYPTGDKAMGRANVSNKHHHARNSIGSATPTDAIIWASACLWAALHVSSSQEGSFVLDQARGDIEARPRGNVAIKILSRLEQVKKTKRSPVPQPSALTAVIASNMGILGANSLIFGTGLHSPFAQTPPATEAILPRVTSLLYVPFRLTNSGDLNR